MSRSELRRGRGLQDDAGASAVEFAVVLPLLLLFVFGIIEFGLAFNRVQSFEAAARAGARYASVGYTTEQIEQGGDGSVNERIRGIAASTVAIDDIEVDVVDDLDCHEPVTTVPGDPDDRTVRVAVRLTPSASGSYRINLPIPGFGAASPDYEREAEFSCEYRP